MAKPTGLEGLNLDPEDMQLLMQAQAASQAASEFEQRRALLFPDTMGMGAVPSEYLSGWERANMPDVYVHPETGGLDYGDGVIVDPATGDPSTGVLYDSSSTAPGSYRWLAKASREWDNSTINKWRKDLRDLGYNVAKKGEFDQTLWTALDIYYRTYYFYGKVLPADVASKTNLKQETDVAYDPVLRRADAREIFTKFWGTEPTDEEINELDGTMAKYTRRALAHGKSPEGARLRGKEEVSEQFFDDPGVQKYQELNVENTELQESMLRAFTALRALGR